MEVPNQIKCDVCGALKGETNGWLIAIMSATPDEPRQIGIAFGPINTPMGGCEDLKIEHICGDGCAAKRFSQWLASLRP
jgi:hypothetical protein